MENIHRQKKSGIGMAACPGANIVLVFLSVLEMDYCRFIAVGLGTNLLISRAVFASAALALLAIFNCSAKKGLS
jgi:hypothetical protein